MERDPLSMEVDPTGVFNPHKRDVTIDVQSTSDSSSSRQHDTFLPWKREKRDASHKAVKMWNSPWLRRTVLISFAALFLCMLAALFALYGASRKNHGLSTETERRHYLWQYGPTALFVLVVSLWRQVDYACKLLSPWQEMYRGPAAAEKTLMLDYVSPMTHESFFTACRNRHWSVVVSIIGFVLLKLATVFSTALLVLEPTKQIISDIPFATTTAFDTNNFKLVNILSSPVETYYGLLERNLPYPVGTSDVLAVQGFDTLKQVPSSSVMSADVLGFQSDLQCEVVETHLSNVTYLPWYGDSVNNPYFLTDITTSDCNITGAVVVKGRNGLLVLDDTQTYQGLYNNYSCNTGIDYSQPRKSWSVDNSSDHRMLLTMADLHWTSPVNTTIQRWWVANITALLCKPTYTLNTYHVSLQRDQPGNIAMRAAQASPSTSPSVLPNFGNGDLMPSLSKALGNTSLGLGGGSVYPLDPFFRLMGLVNNHSDQGAFMDARVFQASAETVFKGVMAQLAHQYLMENSSQSIPGVVEYNEDRLVVKALPAGMIGAALAVLICCSIVELFLRPWDTVPREPDSIAAIAVILASSEAVKDGLSNLSRASASAIRERISQRSYYSTIQPGTINSFMLSSTKQPFKVTRRKSLGVKAPARLTWWRPMAMMLPFQIALVVIPIIGIAALEVLQRLSDRNDGFVAIVAIGVDIQLVIRSVPALLMFGIATLYTVLVFSATAFAPYSALRVGNSPASKSIMVNSLGKMPLHAIYISPRSGHIAVAFTIVATFLASFLTIVVSGLYTIAEVSSTTSVFVQASDTFNFNQADIARDDGLAGLTTSLLEYHNLTYPQWTYGNLAFPALADASFGNVAEASHVPTNGSKAASSTVTLPAVRAVLNCTAVPSENVSVDVNDVYVDQQHHADYSHVSVDVEATLPWMCRDPLANITEVLWHMSLPAVANDTEVLLGTASTLVWPTDGDSVFVSAPGADTNYYRGNFPPGGAGCPSFGYTFASLEVSNMTDPRNASFRSYQTKGNISMVTCQQLVQEVMTTTTLLLPSLSIDTTQPPVPQEDTAKYLNNGTYGLEWEFRPNMMLVSLAYLDHDTINTFDRFFQAAIYGKDGMPADELARSLPLLMNATNNVYSTYMAQAISTNIRSSTPPEGQQLPTYQATLYNPFPQRLKQNSAPKLVLQILLGLMSGCGIVAYLLMDTKTLLPHNPCSIAGVATLLADSELCTRRVIPEGAEWMSDAELERNGVFSGWLFSLGWWGGEGEESSAVEGGRRYGIDVGRAAVS